MVELGNKLKRLRLEKKLTQSQVAKLLGVTGSIISAYENSLRQPSYENLIKLAALYGVSTDYLLGVTRKPALNTNGLSNKEVSVLSELIEIMKIKS
ncbi:helix-turn-helix transcriptional regulator [Anaerolentibacter hominis]|uniref:helix-turn-helix domain-containing protein n=1 Tax=Anaerolentibacter hominis TaxID=3079009 RepID=UPI0031B7F75F